jgi:hypothetical protein
VLSRSGASIVCGDGARSVGRCPPANQWLFPDPFTASGVLLCCRKS